MSTLTRAEVASYASKAGFTGSALDIAVAIAKAESGWNPKAHNGVGKDDSYGLMQINMIGGLGPARRKQFGLKANSDLYDPATNMRVAHGIYASQGFQPWTTYTNDEYKKYLVDSGSVSSSTTGTLPAGSDPVLGVGSAINALGDTFYKVGANIGGILVAVVLLVLGVVIISRNHIPVTKVAKAVLK